MVQAFNTYAEQQKELYEDWIAEQESGFEEWSSGQQSAFAQWRQSYQFVAVCRYQCRRDFPRIYDVLKRFDLILQRPRRIRPENALDPVEPFQKIIRPFPRIIQQLIAFWTLKTSETCHC